MMARERMFDALNLFDTLFFYLLNFYLFYVYSWFVCICLCTISMSSAFGTHWIGVTDGCEPPCGSGN